MVVSTNNTTYQSEKQKLLARPTLPRTRKGAGWEQHLQTPDLDTEYEYDAPPPYSPIAGRYEMVLDDNKIADTLSGCDTLSTLSECDTWSSTSTESTVDQLAHTTTTTTTTTQYGSTTTSSFETQHEFTSTSTYTSFSPEGFATVVTLTTRVVPLASLPESHQAQSTLPQAPVRLPCTPQPRCSTCADGYSAAQLGLSCPQNCS